MIEEGTRVALTILFGALAGGVTNSIAIWMLFHPYEPPRLFGRPIRLIQGAIPKNKARLATVIGRTVGTRLLTGDDLARTVAAPSFREAFDDHFRHFLAEVLERRRGPLAEELPPRILAEIQSLLDQAAGTFLDRLDEYLASDEFHATVTEHATRIAADLEDRPLADVLTPEREAALAKLTERWIEDAVASAGFESAIRDYLDRAAENLLVADRTFEQLLPTGLVAAVERAMASYLPLALERLSGLLEDPRARERLETILHEVLDRFMRDLRFHQRLVAALVMTPDTVERVVSAIEEEGASKISELLQDPAVRDAMGQGVNDAMVDFLGRPVTSVFGRSGETSVEEAKSTVAGWAIGLARDEQTRAFLVERLHTAWTAAEGQTWGDLFRHLPPERVASIVVGAARSERAHGLYQEGIVRLLRLALARPLGRPADYLPSDAATRLERALGDPVWGWIQEQVPPMAQRVDITGRVQQKILEYPTAQLEELIRRVTQRELRLIVRLGWLLGAFIGLILVSINLLLG